MSNETTAKQIADLEKKAKSDLANRIEHASKTGDFSGILVSEIGLSKRARRALHFGGYTDFGDVVDAHDYNLLRCSNLGRTSLKEIRSLQAKIDGTCAIADTSGFEPRTFEPSSLRDYFAGQALAGICSSLCDLERRSDVAPWSYEVADAMMKARTKCD